jgi:hypothetical protein
MGSRREKPTSVSDLLRNSDGILQRLKRGSEQADRTLSAVREVLPAELAGRVWGAAVRGQCLTVLVESAAWAARLRFHSTALRDGVSVRLGATIDRVQLRVRPPGGKR